MKKELNLFDSRVISSLGILKNIFVMDYFNCLFLYEFQKAEVPVDKAFIFLMRYFAGDSIA